MEILTGDVFIYGPITEIILAGNYSREAKLI